MEPRDKRRVQSSLRALRNSAGANYRLAVLDVIRHAHLFAVPTLISLTPKRLVRDDWQEIIRDTQAICRCGRQRLIMGTGSEQADIGLAPDVFTLNEGEHILLGPQVGDPYTAFVSLTLQGGNVVLVALGTLSRLGLDPTVEYLPINAIPKEGYNFSLAWDRHNFPVALLNTLDGGNVEGQAPGLTLVDQTRFFPTHICA